MQSFALWYEKSDVESGNSLTAKLNFNLWTECGWKKNPTYLDIGFMIKNINKASKICMFIPFAVKKDNIKDLGAVLSSSSLAGAIFNENLSATNTQNKLINIENIDSKEHFSIYKLDTDSKTEKDRDVHITPFDDGSILTIDVKNNSTLSKCDMPVYFRFRLQDISDISKLVHKYSAGKKGLQSIFNVVYTIDFRYMNKRCLSETLIEKMTDNNCEKIKIEAVHFLLITKTYVELKTDCTSARKLEEKIWDDYVNLKNLPMKTDYSTNDLIAYHYKKSFKEDSKEDGKDFSAEFFIKYSVEKTIIWLYLLLTIGIGAASSIIANILWNLLANDC